MLGLLVSNVHCATSGWLWAQDVPASNPSPSVETLHTEMVEKINLIRKAQSQALKEQINTLIAKMQDIRYGKAKKSKRNYDHINFKITKLKFELK